MTKRKTSDMWWLVTFLSVMNVLPVPDFMGKVGIATAYGVLNP